MYIPVSVSDIEKLNAMPTDVFIFLPLNNKYIKFLKQGVPPSKFEILSSKSIEKLYIHYSNLKTFIEKRSCWGLEESNEVFKAFAQNSSSGIEKIREIIKTRLNIGKNIDFRFFNYFISDILNIIIPNETSLLYYAITHLNTGKEIPHSQTVSTLSVISAINKGCPTATLPSLGVAGLYHELPLLLKPNYSTAVNEYRPGQLSEESIGFYQNIPINSEGIRLSVEYQNGEKQDILNQILLEADTMVHSGDYSNLHLI